MKDQPNIVFILSDDQGAFGFGQLNLPGPAGRGDKAFVGPHDRQ